MKKAMALTLALLLTLCLCAPAAAEFDNSVRSGVVYIESYVEDLNGNVLQDSEGNYYWGAGSGFFVGKAGEDPLYLITNYHVINFSADNGRGEIQTINYDDGSKFEYRGRIKVYFSENDYVDAYYDGGDDVKDVALLHLKEPTDKRKALPLCLPTDDMVGKKVYAVGYPGIADSKYAEGGTAKGVSDSTVTSGEISRLMVNSSGQRNIQTDCEIKHGNSGGPLLTEDNAVIGITTWSVMNTDIEEVNYVVSIEEAIPLLNQFGVSYDMFDPAAAIDSEPSPEPEHEPTFFEKYGIFLIVAVVVVAGFAVAVVLLLQKNKKALAAAKAAQIPAAVNAGGSAAGGGFAGGAAKKPKLRSHAMQHGGAAIQLPDGNRQITIGRSKSCAIVFSENTPGVSSSHCSLYYDQAAGDFVLMDLRSTYGTFLSTGGKLNPGVPYRLRPGDRFYVGMPENQLSVELE